MKRVLMFGLLASMFSTAALAADFGYPVKAPVMPQSAYSWTGFYIGAHAGFAGGDAVVQDTNGGVPPGPFGYSPNGGFGGLTGGYNYQWQNFVIGIEGDLGYLGTSGKGVIGSANAAAHQDLTLSGGFYGDITGRLGVTYGNYLFYGKGGWAYFDGSAKQQTTNPGYSPTGTSAFNGYTVGGGVEVALFQNVSVKVEYLHYDFGTQGGMQTSISDPPIGYNYLNSTSLKFDTVKVGANYRF